MKVIINNKEIELKKSFRALIIYEEIMKESFSGSGYKELLIYFYSIILSSSKDIEISFDDFIDWLDDNPDSLNEFIKWLEKLGEKENIINNKEDQPKKVDLKKN